MIALRPLISLQKKVLFCRVRMSPQGEKSTVTYPELCALEKGARIQLSYRHGISGQPETANATVVGWDPKVGVRVSTDKPMMCTTVLLIQPKGTGGLQATACPAGTPSWDVSVTIG